VLTSRRPRLVAEQGGLLQLTAAAHPELRVLHARPPLDPEERGRLVRRAKLLAWSGNAWHFVEFAIAVGAGIAAGSIALVGFGVDSLIESLAGFIIIWRFANHRSLSETAERRAQQLVAASYAILVVYILVEATRSLVSGDQPEASWVGIGLAAFTAPTMPLLARAKAPGRPPAWLGRDGQRSGAEPDLRLPLHRTARGPARERAARLVVGRSGGRARDRRGRRQGGRRELEGRQLRLLLRRTRRAIVVGCRD
jgi:hypothetical protein